MKNKDEMKCGVVLEPTPEPFNGKLYELVELLEEELSKYENLTYSVKSSLNRIFYIESESVEGVEISKGDNSIIERLYTCISHVNYLNNLHGLNVEHLKIIV